MSQSNEGNAKGYVANVAIGEGLAVKISSGKAVIATAATDKIIGTTQHKAAADEVVSVKLRSGAGSAKGKSGGTIAVGDRLTSDANGQLIATTTTGNEIVGMALEAAASGDLFEFQPANDRY